VELLQQGALLPLFAAQRSLHQSIVDIDGRLHGQDQGFQDGNRSQPRP
jgi:hypothetical protein